MELGRYFWAEGFFARAWQDEIFEVPAMCFLQKRMPTKLNFLNGCRFLAFLPYFRILHHYGPFFVTHARHKHKYCMTRSWECGGALAGTGQRNSTAFTIKINNKSWVGHCGKNVVSKEAAIEQRQAASATATQKAVQQRGSKQG